MNTEKVTRLEIIHHDNNGICDVCRGEGRFTDSIFAGVKCPVCQGSGKQPTGRDVIFHNKNKQIDVQLQDEGRTLKIFVNERETNAESALPR